MAEFHSRSIAAEAVLESSAGRNAMSPVEARRKVTGYIADKNFTPETLPALAVLVRDVDQQVMAYGSLAKVPAAAVSNIRNDMYLASEAIKGLGKQKPAALSETAQNSLATYKTSLDAGTRFIPTWVKIAVAFALGLGTMVGWRRIVVTVGEKIVKTHLNYAQGAAAELVAMGTILGADHLGLPVSTTHVLSSGVAGTMAANKSGLQMSTIRNLLIAWVLTLPVSIVIAGALYMLFAQIF
jgi:PiT family inorganic phosphate transporter